MYAGRGGAKSLASTKNYNSSHESSIRKNKDAFLVCRGSRCRCPRPRITLSTERDLKVSEDCTDKNQRCSDSRVGPEKHRWVTVQLQRRASQQKCSTLCTVIDEIGVNSQFLPPKKKNHKISNIASDMQVSKNNQRHQPQKGVNATFHNRQSCNLIHENPLLLCTLDVVVNSLTSTKITIDPFKFSH